MRTSPQIGHSFLEQMNLILEFVCRFDVNNLLYAVNGKRYDEERISNITNDIREYHSRMNRQKEHLYKMGKTWNKRYTHEDNSRFDTAHRLAWKIRSGTAGAKKVFNTFCKVSKKKLPDGKPNPQAHEVSLISTPNYIIDIFGMESYPPCVSELFREMLLFYEDLNESLQECRRILQEEKETRGDLKKVLELLNEAIERSRKQQIVIIEAMEQNPQLKQMVLNDESISSDELNPVLKAYKKTSKENRAMFAAKYYHNCSHKDVDKITLRETYAEADEDSEMMWAITIFGNDKEHALRINYAIDHFDTLLPDKCKRGVIPALQLYFFMERCKPAVGVQSFLNYFNSRYEKHEGRWKTIGVSALNGAKGKYNTARTAQQEEYEKTKRELMERLDEMLSEAFPEEETA